MSQYTCRLYRNSGFNAVNIPDSPALLDTIGNYVDCYAIELNQERFLPSVRIRGDWLSCRDADYCKVGDFFYFVDNINMISGDVAELTLTPDFITSAGGPAALEILDGITDRVHVTDDTFGLYGAEDPYLSPALDMDIQTFVKSFNNGNSYTFVETTLDFSEIYDKISGNNLEALSCMDPRNTDPVTGYAQYVVVPSVDYQDQSTEYFCGVGGLSLRLANTKNQAVYCIDDTANSNPFRRAIAFARSLGIEESISGQYEIPAEFIVGSGIAPGIQLTMRGHTGSYNATIPFIFGTAKNKRIFYGSHTPYTLGTASGSTMQARAEEIYHAGLTYPYVTLAVDPRRDGKPYYRFRYLNGQDAEASMDFFRGCVAGKEWLNHPLVFNNKSGSLLDQTNYANSRIMSDMDAWHYGKDYMRTGLESAVRTLGNAAGGVASAIKAGYNEKDFGTAIGGIVNTVWEAAWGAQSAYDRQQEAYQYADRYHAQKAIDQQQLQIAQGVFVPEVKFPVTPDLFAEATGNGFIVARPVYKQADIARIDKILTAYGYKYSKILEASDFNNRTYFNYVSGSITVGNLPRWWANGISAQIGNGVRVWHVKPNHTYYLDNPVVTPTV